MNSLRSFTFSARQFYFQNGLVTTYTFLMNTSLPIATLLICRAKLLAINVIKFYNNVIGPTVHLDKQT